MTDGIAAFMFAVGLSGWSYSKLSQRTGYGNAGAALKVVAIIFIITFIFFYSLLKWVLHIG